MHDFAHAMNASVEAVCKFNKAFTEKSATGNGDVAEHGAAHFEAFFYLKINLLWCWHCVFKVVFRGSHESVPLHLRYE